ncbi:ubiquitin carboxyl-terminal hydrolase 2 isoform X5 [Magallana gigas]|uniref:ubiquitin carboxyl-terminal hydrolase 2 isoform X5 n=2 Tax=Magallana gigas TaxID=29159 RepID=UPI003340D7D4
MNIHTIYEVKQLKHLSQWLDLCVLQKHQKYIRSEGMSNPTERFNLNSCVWDRFHSLILRLLQIQTVESIILFKMINYLIYSAQRSIFRSMIHRYFKCAFQMRPMDNYNLLIKPKRQPPQSLPNIGNTCYANALLQVLGQTPDFYEIVEEACKRETTTKRVTSSFGDLLKHMCTPTFRSIQISVRSFMNNISSREREFMIGYQNDCHSFFLTLLSELHDENPARDITSLFEIEMVDEFIFGSCRHTEITDSQILRSITIPSNSLRIEDGFRELLSEEHFDEEDVPCRQCNRRGFKKTAKAMKFRRLPPILVLQLGCFQEMHYGGHTHIAKSSRRIRFCESVNVPLANGAQDHVTYDLYGVVNHHGSSYGGHYTSYVKQLSSPGDQGPWYYCNDSHIDKANVYTALTSSDAYMLFYKRSQ